LHTIDKQIFYILLTLTGTSGWARFNNGTTQPFLMTKSRSSGPSPESKCYVEEDKETA